MFKPLTLSGIIAVALSLAACVDYVTFNSSSFRIPAKTIPAHLSKPDGKGPFPAVVILHGSDGMAANYTESWPQYLNGLGYVTITPATEVRGRPGPDWEIGEQSDDAYGALDYLANLPFVDGSRVAVMGFSAGGRTIHDQIHDEPRPSDNGKSFKAAISFYGDCSLIAFEKKNGIPLMTLVGDGETNHRLWECLEDHSGTEVEVHVLKDAYHCFDCKRLTKGGYSKRGNNYYKYSPKARGESEELVKAFLAKHLGQ